MANKKRSAFRILKSVMAILGFNPDDPNNPKYVNLRISTTITGVVGFTVIFLYACGGSFMTRFGGGLAIAIGTTMIGAFMGFLFGYPRTIQKRAEEFTNDRVGYRLNTNLEEISDWLTKIIVGIGLVQLETIMREISLFSGKVAEGWGSANSSKAVVIGIMAYFAFAGFMLCFLWTRLWLQIAMDWADNINNDQNNAHYADSKARSLISRFLHPKPNENLKIEKITLFDVLSEATQSGRNRVFRDAQKAVRNKKNIERAITIFALLTELDHERQFHRNHAEVAYALLRKKVVSHSDIINAKSKLDNAIQILETSTDTEYEEYYLARAYCRVKLNEAIDDIIADIQHVPVKGYYIERFRRALPQNSLVDMQKWYSANQSTLAIYERRIFGENSDEER